MKKFSILLLLLSAYLFLPGCIPIEFDNGPSGEESSVIESITVAPNVINLKSGPNKLTVTVVVTIETGSINKDESLVFITKKDGTRIDAAPQSVIIQPETKSIVFEDISKNWLNQVTPGTYNVGVKLVTTLSTIEVNDTSKGILTIKN